MSDMGYTYYGFRRCVGAFFETATTDARKLLPPHLEPLEMQHERSILALTAFQFHESEVGEYEEIVLAVIVPPMVEPGKPLPKAAFYRSWSAPPPKRRGCTPWSAGTSLTT